MRETWSEFTSIWLLKPFCKITGRHQTTFEQAYIDELRHTVMLEF